MRFVDFGPYYSLDELRDRLAYYFLQSSASIVSVETLSNTPKEYAVRVWIK